jgi:hypothetical protein
MEKLKQILCTLIIPNKNYMELTEEVKELFTMEDGYYSTQFPADAEEDSFLGEFLQAFCEVVLIINNPKYEVTDDCVLSTELLKLGPTEESYCLQVNIKYPGADKIYHDTLYFKEVSQSLGYYTFELLGDQTIFSVD